MGKPDSATSASLRVIAPISADFLPYSMIWMHMAHHASSFPGDLCLSVVTLRGSDEGRRIDRSSRSTISSGCHGRFAERRNRECGRDPVANTVSLPRNRRQSLGHSGPGRAGRGPLSSHSPGDCASANLLGRIEAGGKSAACVGLAVPDHRPDGSLALPHRTRGSRTSYLKTRRRLSMPRSGSRRSLWRSESFIPHGFPAEHLALPNPEGWIVARSSAGHALRAEEATTPGHRDNRERIPTRSGPI